MYKIAVVSFANPLAFNVVGAVKVILNNIKALSLIEKCRIDIYYLANDYDVLCDKVHFDNVKLYGAITNNSLNAILSKFPISVNNRYNSNLAELMKKNGPYSLAIYEGTHTILYRIRQCIKAKMHILYLHDIESRYRMELFKSNKKSIVSILQLAESYKYKYVENNFLNLFDKLLFLSKYELEQSRKFYPCMASKMQWLPPTIDIPNKKFTHNNVVSNKHILYFGDLSLSYNYEGLKWFVDKALPIVVGQMPDVVLDIIGNIKNDYRDYLKNNNTILHGYVEDLDQYISRADLIILPILHGAGVKIKLVESISHGKIIIATKKAVEGTDLTNKNQLLITNNPKIFAGYIIKIIKCKERYLKYGHSAYLHALKVYSLENKTRFFADLLSNIK